MTAKAKLYLFPREESWQKCNFLVYHFLAFRFRADFEEEKMSVALGESCQWTKQKANFSVCERQGKIVLISWKMTWLHAYVRWQSQEDLFYSCTPFFTTYNPFAGVSVTEVRKYIVLITGWMRSFIVSKRTSSTIFIPHFIQHAFWSLGRHLYVNSLLFESHLPATRLNVCK